MNTVADPLFDHSRHTELIPARAPAASTWPHFLVGQPDQPIRVLLVDDDAHMRRVVSQELLTDPRIHLVGQGA